MPLGTLIRLAVVAAALAAQLAGCAGERPGALGVRDGRLSPCPPTPNCVASQTDRAVHPGHYVAPLALRGDAAQGWLVLVALVRDSDRTRIVAEQPGYLHAEATSRVLGFVDDLELQLDAAAGIAHVRSASRVGRSDFGVNRARIDALRARLAAAGR